MFLVSICNARFLGVPGAIVSVSLLLELGVPLSSSHTTECPHLQRTDFSHARIVSLLVPTVSCLAILKDCILAPSDRLGLFFVLHGSR